MPKVYKVVYNIGSIIRLWGITGRGYTLLLVCYSDNNCHEYNASDHSRSCKTFGATEKARPDIERPAKLWGLTSQDWTTRQHIARVDIARLVSMFE